jgi:asparagine synthase (glutamine-hydrolysing)
MCGITGIWRLDGGSVDERQVIAARDALTARGPDDSGLRVEGSIGLAHRRLSIIDLSHAGRMPMANEDGTIWAVFNGEIYNFKQLRTELVGRGHRFRSQTDSEVIVHAYEEWGTGAFEKFDGMFALAIWDEAIGRLVLARDAVGEKPLFYLHRDALVVFSSTLYSLLEYRGVPRAIDTSSLLDYIELGFVPAPSCLIEGASKVEPGTYVVFTRDRAPERHVYWSLDAVAGEAEPPPSLEQATDGLHQLLRKAVRDRMTADVPLGAFLSGGVDSSLVVALMAEAATHTVRTFTIAFRETEFDESEYAHRVAKHLGVENTSMVLSAADVLRELPAVTAAMDEPMADVSVLPSLAVARLARRHVTVALTGDGADEAFGGYRYYAGTRFFEAAARFIPQRLRQALAGRASLLRDARVSRAVSRGGSRDAAAYFGHCGFYRGATSGGSVRRILVPGTNRKPVEETVADFIRERSHLRPTEAGMLWDATHTLPDAWLAKVDRTTMAVGLEARAPFLSRAVLEYAFRLPLDARVRGADKKIVLRRVLARYLPRAMIERPKQGFTAPLKAWFAGELREELYERLAPERVARFGIFDPGCVAVLLREQHEGRADHTQLLWALFHLDRWYERLFEVR